MNCKNCKLVLSCTVASNGEDIECERYVKKPNLKKWRVKDDKETNSK